jgi:hypothetical protein
MTREQVAERARRAIPDFLRRRKPDPPKVAPSNKEARRTGKIDWSYLFKLAERHSGDEKGA